MKIGVRKVNVKNRIKARTTGKVKRKLKKTVNPFYGKKGMGWIRNPKKALYNKVYHKTSIGVDDIAKAATGKQSTEKSKKRAKWWSWILLPTVWITNLFKKKR